MDDEHRHTDAPEAVSLDELTQAFAQAMGVEHQPAQRAREAADKPVTIVSEEPVSERPAEAEPEMSADQHGPCEISPRSILEAMLFVGNRDGQPLAAAGAADLMRGVEPEEIAALVDELNRRYAVAGCPYQVVEEGPGYRLVLRGAFHPLRNRFYGQIRAARLSQAAVDVLAIVAYQQPLTTEQVSRLRGRPSGNVLSQLVRRGLLRIEQDQTKRRTRRYSTTDRFLALFGLEGLDDLPQSEDLQGQ